MKAFLAISALSAVLGIALSSDETLNQLHRPILIATVFIFFLLLVSLTNEFKRSLREQQEKIEQLMGIKLVLASLIDLKDKYTEGHSRNVRDLTTRFSQFLKLSPTICEQNGLAAELHDIGKIGIPDAILNKPDSLNADEFSAIRNHPKRGSEALSTLHGFEAIRNIILHHHERFDGQGYPGELVGEQIPLGARIITLADSYDTLLQGRIYKAPMALKEIRQIFKEQSGKQFDPGLCSEFIKFLDHGMQAGILDPVCGMPVNQESGRFVFSHERIQWVFCSKTCLRQFTDSPQEYLTRLAPKPELIRGRP